MKLSREIIIGIVATLTIACFIWLLNFLKGHNLFKQTDSYTIVYSNINGLQASSPVEVNGYQVGIVGNVRMLNDGSGKIASKINLEEKISIPRNSIAEITPASLIAGMKIRLLFSDESAYHNPGDTLIGQVDPGILGQVETKMEPLSKQFENLLSKVDTLTGRLNNLLDEEMINSVKQTASHMEASGRDLSELLKSQREKLEKTSENLNTLSDVLANRSEDMDQVLINMRLLSDTLVSEQSLQSYQSLQNSLRLSDSLLQGMVNGNGTIGKVFRDESLYQNLNTSLTTLDSLLNDLMEDPGRYVHFSLFGRKK